MTTEQALATLAEYIDHSSVRELRAFSNPSPGFTPRDKEAWTALRVLAGAK